MQREDFDISGLAEYLHLSAAQVQKMADRGQLPGRRIGGQWKFSPAAIHHWLEERIGVSDDGELSQMETVLEKDALGNIEVTTPLISLLPEYGIAVPLQARTRNAVISAMIELATGTGMLWDPEKMEEAVRARETLHSTALENGVALLHPRRPLGDIIADPFFVLGVTSSGIPFGGERGTLTDIFFLICSTEDRGHLRFLARLSRLLAQPDFVSGLRCAPDAYAIREIMTDAEKQIA